MTAHQGEGRPDNIRLEAAATLHGVFSERVRLSPDATACRYYDSATGQWCERTWSEMDGEVSRWQSALAREGLVAGDRVAVMLANSPEWVIADQAAMRLGLVVVPVYVNDLAGNAVYTLQDSGARLLLLENQTRWQALATVGERLHEIVRVVMVRPGRESRKTAIASGGADGSAGIQESNGAGFVCPLDSWLPAVPGEVPCFASGAHDLAAIIYTSGTSGRPKGVMLSHHNILSNVRACLQAVPLSCDDLFLSFLPLSHALERTVGYYAPVVCGATIVYTRSIQQLQEDMVLTRPTILVSVPRIYERMYAAIQTRLATGPAFAAWLFNVAVEVGYSRFEYAQGHGSWKLSHLLWPWLEKRIARKVTDKMGGNLRQAISGGAALSPEIARVFIGLGLPVLQGYGMTESSPVVCCNRLGKNRPASVGLPLPGVEARLGENNTLQIRGPNVMSGYWNNPEATAAVLSADGWLDSGDTATIDEQGYVTITGRLKEIIVMSNGEKVPPADIETAILRDALFQQVMLAGEGKPYLCLLVVPDEDRLRAVAMQVGIDPYPAVDLAGSKQIRDMLLKRIALQTKEFAGYARVRRITLIAEPWTVENGLLTPTLKLRRKQVMERYGAEIRAMYEGHHVT